MSIWVIVIVAVLVLFLLLLPRSTKWADRHMRMYLMVLSPDAIDWAWNGFLFFAGVIVTLYAAGATGRVNMTGLWIIVGCFVVLGVLGGMRNRMAPRALGRLSVDEFKTILKEAVRDGVVEGVKHALAQQQSGEQDVVSQGQRHPNEKDADGQR